MGAALEQAFYEKLAEMPSDVRFVDKGIFNDEFYENRKLKLYLIHRKQLLRKVRELEI